MKLNIKLKKKTIIILAVIFVFVIVPMALGQVMKKGPQYLTQKVERMNLAQTVEATGKVKSGDEIALNFKTGGRIQKVAVDVGAKVKKGQMLAYLEAGDLRSQVDSAIAKLNQAQAEYEKVKTGATAEDVYVSENTVAQKEQEFISAKNDLTNLIAEEKIEMENLRETALTYLNNETATSKSSLEEIENTLEDDDAQGTLGAKDSMALPTAEEEKSLADTMIVKNETEIDGLSILSSDENILLALDNLKKTLSQTATALDSTADVLTATMISSSLSETELDALKSNIKAQQAKISAAQINIQTTKANLSNQKISYQNQITAAQDAVEQAEKAINVAKAQLNLKKAPAQSYEINSVLAQVEQARANLNLAYANLNETIVSAPIDGMITEKNFSAGEQSSLTTPVLKMIGDAKLQIEVNVPESDIVKIDVDKKAEIDFDALGADKIFTGLVFFIEPAETNIQDVIYYKVKIQITSTTDGLIQKQTEIKPGMTANVTIMADQREKVLVVPARAVKSSNGDKYVEILKDKKIEKKNVITGLRGDDGLEIISGVEEGEEVVVGVKE